MFDDQKKTTADESKLVFETPHTSRRDETRRAPTSPVSSRRLVCDGQHTARKRFHMNINENADTLTKFE